MNVNQIGSESIEHPRFRWINFNTIAGSIALLSDRCQCWHSQEYGSSIVGTLPQLKTVRLGGDLRASSGSIATSRTGEPHGDFPG